METERKRYALGGSIRVYYMNTELTLYKQISRKLENDILTGKLPPGCRIPSVRELAAQYQVNPNTVQRAVRELNNQDFWFLHEAEERLS